MKGKRIRLHILLAGIFLAGGCSQRGGHEIPADAVELPEHIRELENLTVYPADARPSSSIHLEHEITFGETDEILIGRLGDMTVDEKDQVFISDPTQHTIHLFGPDGGYISSFGREGSGPGEFRFITKLEIISGRFYVYDSLQLRMTVFTLNPLTYSHTINLGSLNQPAFLSEWGAFSLRDIFIRNNGQFLIQFGRLIQTPPSVPGQQIGDLNRRYYLADSDGSMVTDEIFKQKDVIWLTASVVGSVQLATNFPFLGKPMIAVSPEGVIYSAWSEDFLIEIRDPSGDYQRAFYYPYENIRLTEADAFDSEIVEYRQHFVRQNELPQTWPVMNDMLIDDQGRLWISSIAEDLDLYEWRVLKDNGELLARFIWRRDEPIELVANGKMYTRITDEETGLQRIGRYRVQMDS